MATLETDQEGCCSYTSGRCLKGQGGAGGDVCFSKVKSPLFNNTDCVQAAEKERRSQHKWVHKKQVYIFFHISSVMYCYA